MDNEARQQLIAIVKQYGLSICDEPGRLEGLLNDTCGRCKKEIRLLINTLKAGVVKDLQSGHNNNTSLKLLLSLVSKNLEDELSLSSDGAIWAAQSWAAALGLMTNLSPGLSAREEIDNILQSPDYIPQNLIEFLKRDLKKEFMADAAVWEGYTIEEHTTMALNQFEKYFSHSSLPGEFSVDTFRMILALHDIGVSAAVIEGTKRGLDKREAKKVGAPKYTAEFMESVMGRLSYDRKEINVAKALVSDNPIGNYLVSGNFQIASIKRMANESGMKMIDFFELLLIFYMVDAGSYTEDAGGQKALDYLFIFDTYQQKMTFSRDTLIKINKLRKALSW